MEWIFYHISDCFNAYKSIFNKISISGLNLDISCLNTSFMSQAKWQVSARCWLSDGTEKIGVGFMVNLASWKDEDLFSPPSLHNDVSFAGGLVTTFPPYSATQTWIYSDSFSSIECPKNQERGEFQQRGQKNSANSLQMCLWAVWGNTVLPSLERKRTLHGESSTNYEQKTLVTEYSWFCLSVWCSREEKGGNLGTHAHSFLSLWRNCWYAGSQKCTLVILIAITHWPKQRIHNCFILKTNSA